MKRKLAIVCVCVLMIFSFTACSLGEFEIGGLVGELFEQISAGEVLTEMMPLPEETYGGDVQTDDWLDLMPDPPIMYVAEPLAFEDPHIQFYYAKDTLVLQEVEVWNADYYEIEKTITGFYEYEGIDLHISYTEMQSEDMVVRANNVALSGALENDLYYFPLSHYGVAYNTFVPHMYNLNELPGYKPYDSEINRAYREQATIGGKLYSTVGGMTPLARFEVDCLAYNPAVAAQYGLDLYDMVLNDGWTWEAMLGISEVCMNDLNGDGVFDGSDRYAFAFGEDEMQTFLLDNSGKSLGLRQEPTDDVLAYVKGISAVNAEQLLELSYVKNDYADIAFAKYGNIMLCPTTLSELAGLRSGRLRDYDTFSYGILPAPKYSYEQQEYAASAIRSSAIFSVGISSERDPMGALLTNVENYLGQELTPRMEKLLTEQISSGPQDANMMRLIMDSTCYDLDRIILEDFGRYINLMYDDRWESNDYNRCMEQYQEMHRYLVEIALEQMANIH